MEGCSGKAVTVNLRSQCLRGLQVEVIVQVQVVQILPMNQKVEHVVALATHLQPDLNPVQFSLLEELSGFQGLE